MALMTEQQINLDLVQTLDVRQKEFVNDAGQKVPYNRLCITLTNGDEIELPFNQLNRTIVGYAIREADGS